MYMWNRTVKYSASNNNKLLFFHMTIITIKFCYCGNDSGENVLNSLKIVTIQNIICGFQGVMVSGNVVKGFYEGHLFKSVQFHLYSNVSCNLMHSTCRVKDTILKTYVSMIFFHINHIFLPTSRSFNHSRPFQLKKNFCTVCTSMHHIRCISQNK